MSLMRLDKLLGEQGLASRRELKEIIRQGRVSVDGLTADRPEQKVDPEHQRVCLDGAPVRWRKSHVYMMDKPSGVITATEAREQRTVLDLLPDN